MIETESTLANPATSSPLLTPPSVSEKRKMAQRLAPGISLKKAAGRAANPSNVMKISPLSKCIKKKSLITFNIRSNKSVKLHGSFLWRQRMSRISNSDSTSSSQ